MSQSKLNPISPHENGRLILEDGTEIEGVLLGYPKSVAGEVVFNTGMVGYPEALTDPSYNGQILVLTYPLIGNYGIPSEDLPDVLSSHFESGKIQIAGLIVAEASFEYSHWSASWSLSQWLSAHRVPGLTGVDTRSLTKLLRKSGTMLGKIIVGREDTEFLDPNRFNLVSKVSVQEPIVYPAGKKRVVLVDCGCKNSIIRCLLQRDLTVIRVPWDHDFSSVNCNGLVLSNGPGDPRMCEATIIQVRKAIESQVPILGICLGHQILALASGADTFKLKFGHRGQNQPCTEVGTKRCYITSQNHGFAVNEKTLTDGWTSWFVNNNDGTNEGIRHRFKPYLGVQFHPEAAPGPLDTQYLFDEFAGIL